VSTKHYLVKHEVHPGEPIRVKASSFLGALREVLGPCRFTCLKGGAWEQKWLVGYAMHADTHNADYRAIYVVTHLAPGVQEG
jgi:hypothetical protein